MTENENRLVELLLVANQRDIAAIESATNAVRIERLPPEKLDDIRRAHIAKWDAEKRAEDISEPFPWLWGDGPIGKWYVEWKLSKSCKGAVT